MIYRYWSQDELDRQMNARATVDDVMPFLAAYAKESGRMRATLPCRVGVAYGRGEAETLDIFLARRPGSPIFFFIHGGFWRALHAADSSFMAAQFVEAGAAVVAVNYALTPAVTIDEIVRQCRSALVHVWAHAADFNGDPGRIHVSGSSAGGHLGGMMLAGGWQAELGAPATLVQSASLLSGLYDLEPVRLSYCNEWARLDAVAAARNSPLAHLPAEPPPLIVSYAPSETAEFKRQSETYMAAYAARGGSVQFVAEPGTNHFDLPLRFMDAEGALTLATMRLMGL